MHDVSWLWKLYSCFCLLDYLGSLPTLPLSQYYVQLQQQIYNRRTELFFHCINGKGMFWVNHAFAFGCKPWSSLANYLSRTATHPPSIEEEEKSKLKRYILVFKLTLIKLN